MAFICGTQPYNSKKKNIIYRCVTFPIDYHRLPKVVCKSGARNFGVQKKPLQGYLQRLGFSLLYVLWTSQGLNLGPPDYESVALTN